MPIDMSKYLGLFVTEATEHLDALARELVGLEKQRDPGAIDSVFRHAHSVKGMAASMGFEQIAVLAHRLEDLVELIRARPEVLGEEAGDLILSATDHMQALVRAAGDGSEGPDASALIHRIGDRLLTLTGKQPRATRVIEAVINRPSPPPGAVPAAAPSVALATRVPGSPLPLPPAHGLLPPRVQVRVQISPGCRIPGVRAFLVHRKLSDIGNVFDLQPPLDDLKAGRIPGGLLTLILETGGGPEAVQKALSVVADLESVEAFPPEPVTAIAPPALPGLLDPGARPVGDGPARTVRVRTELLDWFLDAAGELLLSTANLRELNKALPEGLRPPLDEGVDRLHALVKDLHGKVMSVRMTPLSLITDRLPRAARDIARRSGRDVELVIEGAEIELDRAILDDLSDPVLHILRNCIDHGLEDPAGREAAGKPPRGRVSVTAHRDRDRVLVQIEDDGRGMDAGRLKAAAVELGLVTPEAVRSMGDREALLLCCLPGVSTARDVSDISGRGVGMDTVKRAAENVGGSLEIDSMPGRGTRFTLRLPLTVAVINVLLVGVGEEVFGLPIAKVKAVEDAGAGRLARSRGAPMLLWAGALVPVHDLSRLLGFEPLPASGSRSLVVVDAELGQVALEVEHLYGQQEAVLKPLSRPLDLVGGLAGVTILGTGRPIFILDVPRLLAA